VSKLAPSCRARTFCTMPAIRTQPRPGTLVWTTTASSSCSTRQARRHPESTPRWRLAPWTYDRDDAVVVQTNVPGRGCVRIAGIVAECPRSTRRRQLRHRRISRRARCITGRNRRRRPDRSATRFEPELFVPPMPGLTAIEHAASTASAPCISTRCSGRLAGGYHATTSPSISTSIFSRWQPPVRTVNNLRHFGRRYQDHLRTVPAVRAVPLGGARRVPHEHQGDRLQRQGRGLDVARSTERRT